MSPGGRTWGALALITALASACGTASSTPALVAPAGTPSGADGDHRLQIVCTSQQATLIQQGSTVVTRPDGVLVTVDNRAGEPVTITGLGVDFGPGVHTRVLAAPPGRVDVACWPSSGHSGGDPPPTRPVVIADVGGFWVSPKLDCPVGSAESRLIADHVADADGQRGDPVDLARQTDVVEHGDVVQDAAYARSPGVVRVRRDGRTIAVLHYHRPHDAEQSRWQLGTVQRCHQASSSQRCAGHICDSPPSPLRRGDSSARR